jgi:hypothetical protein
MSFRLVYNNMDTFMSELYSGCYAYHILIYSFTNKNKFICKENYTPFGFVALPAFVARDRRDFCPSIRGIIRNVKNINDFYLNEDELLILN